jgi:hypothetical protein
MLIVIQNRKPGFYKDCTVDGGSMSGVDRNLITGDWPWGCEFGTVLLLDQI